MRIRSFPPALLLLASAVAPLPGPGVSPPPARETRMRKCAGPLGHRVINGSTVALLAASCAADHPIVASLTG